LNRADYSNRPKLIISLEGGASSEVKALAHKFYSSKLDVEVIERKKRLGLRDHVIECGNLTKRFGSVLILEDDILVDPFFYRYAEHAMEFYQNESTISGISLYAQEYNEFANRPFRPMANGYSTYLMQVPCSWGQAWNARQWDEFMSWYVGKSSQYLDGLLSLPPAVKKWPESSWKKFFHAFMCEQEKYFVYPYASYTTNCSDPGGTHNYLSTAVAQVSMALPNRRSPEFDFCPTHFKEVLYDAFMEPVGDFIYREIGFSRNECELDLYATKPLSLLMQKPFVITAKAAKESIKLYNVRFKPHEVNLWLCGTQKRVGELRLARTQKLKKSMQLVNSFKLSNYYSPVKTGDPREVFYAAANFFLRVARFLVRRLLKG
jgi:hypothetical protein